MSSNYCDTCWCPYVFHTLGDNSECMNPDCNMINYARWIFGPSVCSEFVETTNADNNK